MYKFRYYFYLFILVLINPAFAAPPVLHLTDPSDVSATIALLPYTEFIEDSEGKLGVTDVAMGSRKFKAHAASTGQYANFGLSQSDYWLRFSTINLTKDEDWYLEIGGSVSRKVLVFIKDNDVYKKLEPMRWSMTNRFHLTFEHNQKTTIYLQIQDPSGALIFSPRLFSAAQMLDTVSYKHAFYAALMAGLLILAAYNFIYYLHIRDTAFLMQSVFIAAFALEMGNGAGLLHFFPWVTSNLYWIGASFAFVVMISGFHLARSLLDVKQQLPHLLVWYHAGMVAGFVLMMFALVFGFGLPLAGLVGVYGIVLILVTLLKLIKQKYVIAKSLVISILIFLSAGLPLLLTAIGLIEPHPQISDRFFIAMLVSLLLLSLTQAEKIRLESEQLERTAATNQAKDEFLTTMSHELRTPMNAVVGAGRLLKLTTLSKEQVEYVTRLNSSSGHMLSLVNDLLDLARVDHQLLQLEKTPFKLEEILNTLKQLLSESATKKQLKLILSNHFLPLNKLLVGDPTRLNQVLLNLLNNAIKFTHSGNVSLTITPAEIEVDCVSLYFEVSDTGIGLTKAQQGDLFQPFAQAESSTNRQYGGSGLGLAISQKLVKRMGGQLNVSSVYGQGSCFSFNVNFPLVTGNLKQEKVSETRPEDLQGYRVLLVDDDEMNRFFGQKLLEACGVEATVAESGEAAISLLQQQPFDLVFMDISMPNVDGYEATRRIRLLPELNNVIVIALTAHAVAGERERCLAAGMDDYLTKPFELDDLQNMMIKWLAKSDNNAQFS